MCIGRSMCGNIQSRLEVNGEVSMNTLVTNYLYPFAFEYGQRLHSATLSVYRRWFSSHQLYTLSETFTEMPEFSGIITVSSFLRPSRRNRPRRLEVANPI